MNRTEAINGTLILALDETDSAEVAFSIIRTERTTGRGAVILVVPNKAEAFQTMADFKTLERTLRGFSLQVGFITAPFHNCHILARDRAFPVFRSLEEYERHGLGRLSQSDPRSARSEVNADMPASADKPGDSTGDTYENVEQRPWWMSSQSSWISWLVSLVLLILLGIPLFRRKR